MWPFKKSKFTVPARVEYEARVREYMELVRYRNLAEKEFMRTCKSADELLDYYINCPGIIPPPVWEE